MEWVTTENAAKVLGVGAARIRAMVGDGLLEGEKQGRDLMVSLQSVQAQKSDYGRLSTAMRIRVLVRDRLTCQECSATDDDPSFFHVHHKVKRSEGGTNEIENLVTLCCDCHRQVHGVGLDDGGAKQQVNVRMRSVTVESLKRHSAETGLSQAVLLEQAWEHFFKCGKDAPPVYYQTHAPTLQSEVMTDPAAIAGVQRGVGRESGADRARREEKEREARVRARSSIGDDPSFCADAEFAQE
jgi:5-methylcytosine-specific restriction endonuclease McrA